PLAAGRLPRPAGAAGRTLPGHPASGKRKEDQSMSIRSLVCFALFVVPATATSAPAPFPRKDHVRSEVVFSARTAARARALVRVLRSRSFLDRVLRNEKLNRLCPLHGARDRSAWLASHLQVEVP